MTSASSPPVALTIAGSDNSAGAGVQADLKTFTALGVYGLTAVTCVVAEVPGKVAAVQPIDLEVIRAQVSLSFSTYPITAVKLGLLHSREVVDLVADLWETFDPKERPPLVVDPVMVATSGHRLLSPNAVLAYRERLFPLATVVTPNLYEASALLDDRPLPDLDALREAGCELTEQYGAAFLMKGGHLVGEQAFDFLCLPGGEVHAYQRPFVRGISTHGTGCTYSAAITAHLAYFPDDLPAAVQRAKSYVSAAIEESHTWFHAGRRTSALCHQPRTIDSLSRL